MLIYLDINEIKRNNDRGSWLFIKDFIYSLLDY